MKFDKSKAESHIRSMFTQPTLEFTVGDWCKLSKTCSVTKKIYEIEIDYLCLCIYNEGNELIQDCFPTLDAGERDFIKFGCTPEEWDMMI